MSRKTVQTADGRPLLGSKVRFVPSCNVGCSEGFSDELMTAVTGTVVEVNAPHRWFRVEFQMGSCPGCTGYETFKY